MADSSWMRLMPGQRCRTPVSPWLHNGQPDNEDTIPHEAANLKLAPRPLAGFNQSSADFASDILVREADRLQDTPSVDEMADVLRTNIMVSPTPPILDPRYTSYVLHLVEGYSKLRSRLSAKEKEIAQLKAKQQEDREDSMMLFADWLAQEARYRAEIKRLELIIQQVSGKGVDAVALARSGSLIRKGEAGRALTTEAATPDQVPAEEDSFQDECKSTSPCKSTDIQGGRTSMSSDALDITARLNAKNQLWRHRSENNLREPSRRLRAGQREHCNGHLLLHLTPFHLRLNMDTLESEPKEECDLEDEQRLHESDTDDSE
ncbi:hypothetical protein MKX08_003137 [Trichoderma sp. CBMAI-0020]|nr:hypothetical protein MKX08_003137 [Trichoderma sp. CBMAI-0020]